MDVKTQMTEVRGLVQHQVRSQAWRRSANQVSAQILFQVHDQVQNKVLGQVWDQVSVQFNGH